MDETTRIGARDLRRHHLGLVLTTIVRDAPVTRAAVATRTGLTRSTVSALTGVLVDDGLVRDIGPGPEAAAGRPGHRLVPDPAGPVGVGLQVERDHVGGCLVDLAGRAGPRRHRPADLAGAGPAVVARAVRTVLRTLLWDAVSADRLVAGIVAGVPGVVAQDHRTVREAPALGLTGVDLGGLLAGEAGAVGAGGIPLSVRSGVALAAAAEPGTASGVVVHVGGHCEVGVVAVRDGRVEGGDAATRFGHLTVRSGGLACPCGRTGCLNAELRAGGAEDERALRRAGRTLGEALAGFAAPLAPVAVVLGGRFRDAGPGFCAAVGSALVRHGVAPGSVRRAELGPDAAMRGAGTSAVAGLLADPCRTAR
ncbi:ROK family transcriptional regulator [Pseudonocardia sp. KRD291]|uniref:ROK family transcriptional regulator n=1 Tax=Pseudonocardia sp. KRD291 TaxID=2792007 RepID=UPI001C4A6906|nr:ROK family transcriptional regulator [Pseudonocardia sp. KRD291]MBW0104112.1 ROK family transcriptional regulator [Pseudonocardia sp. KRD291]